MAPEGERAPFFTTLGKKNWHFSENNSRARDACLYTPELVVEPISPPTARLAGGRAQQGTARPDPPSGSLFAIRLFAYSLFAIRYSPIRFASVTAREFALRRRLPPSMIPGDLGGRAPRGMRQMGLSATQRAAGAAGSVPPWLPEVILSGLVTAFGGYGRARAPPRRSQRLSAHPCL